MPHVRFALQCTMETLRRWDETRAGERCNGRVVPWYRVAVEWVWTHTSIDGFGAVLLQKLPKDNQFIQFTYYINKKQGRTFKSLLS